ncbi:GNAT family N-acetyltransferase [Anoxybacter fermentans]
MGLAILRNPNLKDGNAEVGLLLDKRYWNRGYGTDILSAFIPA